MENTMRIISFFTLFLFAIGLTTSCGSASTDSKETSSAETAITEQSTTTEHNTLTDAEKAAGWELLFDGKALTQWKGYNRPDLPSAWIVKDGMMTLDLKDESKEGGDIITKAAYENFELQLDFKLYEETNSGVLYRVVEVEDTPIWHNAPEYQLIDDYHYIESAGLEKTKTHLTGDNYDMQVAVDKTFKPIEEWNTAKIVVNNGKVEHHLNGKKVVEYDTNSEEWAEMVQNSKFKDYEGYGKNAVGHIGLQDHGHDIAFRNLKIRKL